ncbi:hypothetical protein NMG60_11003005 [Bertholletia excelsa]
MPESAFGYDVPISKPEVVKSMKVSLYRKVINGDKEGLENELQDRELNLLEQVTPKEDTILHLAARLGYTHLVELILQHCRDLFKRRNSSKDNPLHLAASAGHSTVVEFMIRWYNDQASAPEIKEVVTGKNNDGNTPLHLALKYRHGKVADLLFKASEEVSYRANRDGESPLYMAAEAGYENLFEDMNRDGESPLYMAAEAGYENLFEDMMRFAVSNPSTRKRPVRNRKPILHAAIKSRNIGVLRIALNLKQALLSTPDSNGRTLLSYAASIGYLEGVRHILDNFDQEAYKRDKIGGSCPIHWAAKKGHVGVIQEILERFPDSMDILNGWDQNVLHVAAKSGQTNVVSHILQKPDLQTLINERDIKGNTPLHLAALNHHPRVVSILTWDKRVSLGVKNDDGHTALDALHLYGEEWPSFRQRLTWMALKQANAPRGHSRITPRCPYCNKVPLERVNTLLLMATLVTTVTFASGVALPGGLHDTGSHRMGTAVLLRKAAFQVFLISDTIALYSSIIATLILVWAQLNDLNLAVNSLNYALPLLGLSLTMVSLAFMAGVYVMVSNLVGMAWLILVLGSISIIFIMMLLVLHLLPSSINNQVLRYIVYYPFCLLILLSKSNADEVDSDEL